MASHTLQECAQGPTIDKMSNVLDRVVIALETIAEHGARVSGLEKQGDKNAHDLRELFGRVRIIENGKAEASDVKALDTRVHAIELFHAEERGEEVITEKSEKFWESVKIQLFDKFLIVGIFAIILADKLNIGVWLAKMWKEIFR